MKSKTRLDSVVFHLTPTRTRCDLAVTANGKTEKIASGLLNPFLAHLKEAQEQIEKGGYSIVLEPKPGSDAVWFTKGTVERFVRFVSTPEILERVYTIESEILQIEKSLSVHVDSENGGPIQADNHPTKSEESIEGCKPVSSGHDEKAIVLYQPTNQLQEEDGSAKQEKNSKVQLIQVLQTRKTALQKEQGMAFARAIAASFDIDNISDLISFAECFGASRMMDACKKFVDLWKTKHEVGQWVEVQTDATMSCRTDMASMSASGIMFVNSNEQGDVASENNGTLFATGGDIKPQADHQGQPNSQHHVPSQFAPPMFAPWQMHPQANGMPVFQPYSPQGMPYYQNYPVNSPYYQSPHTPLDDSRKQVSRRTKGRRHSMDSRDLSSDSDTQEIDDNVDMDEDSVSRRRRKTGGKSSRKQSGVVVIRNINYIASANQGSSDGEQESHSDHGIDNEDANLKGDEMRKSKKKGDDGQWQAFQNFLLKDADESSNSVRSNMFEMEGNAPHNKRQPATGDAASVLTGRNLGDNDHVGFGKSHDIAGDMTRARKPINDQLSSYGQQANLVDVWDSSFDPVIADGISRKSNSNNKGSSHGILDESSMILKRSGSHDQVVSDSRSVMDVNYEHPSLLKKAEDHTVSDRSRNYEPNDLSLMPDRVMEDGLGSYDPALDYEMQAQVNKAANARGKEITQDVKERPRKGVKEQKLKGDKRVLTSSRKEKPNKFSPSEDARARADRLRAFKADLQKQKKEKEEEQRRRIEALKMERQKRIAARSGGNPASSSLSSPQPRKQPPKLSPVSQKGSKFSDTEPGSSSPLQRSTLKFISKIQSDPSKNSKSGRLNFGSPVSGGNRLTRSASSLSARKEDKNDTTPESKATNLRIKRLSEPKGTVHRLSLGKTRSAEAVSRRRASEGTELKKIPGNANPAKTISGSSTEMKLRASKGLSVSTQKKLTITEKRSSKMVSSGSVSANMRVGNTKSSLNRIKENAKTSSPSEVNEDTLVDKTVVMLECGKSSQPIKHTSEEKFSVQDEPSDTYKLDTNQGDDVAVPPPASPIIVKEVDREPFDGQIDTHLNERRAPGTEDVLPNISKSGTSSSLCQPPYARVSSLEDPCMTKSEYAKAFPTGLDMTAPITETTSVHLPDDQRGDLPSILEVSSGNHVGKESSKGFKQLFKFGKKNSAANESSIDSTKATLAGSVDDARTSNAASSEVFTLRNLLVQEESSASVTTPKKSSKTFSLLSPFRSKTREKKSTA